MDHSSRGGGKPQLSDVNAIPVGGHTPNKVGRGGSSSGPPPRPPKPPPPPPPPPDKEDAAGGDERSDSGIAAKSNGDRRSRSRRRPPARSRSPKRVFEKRELSSANSIPIGGDDSAEAKIEKTVEFLRRCGGSSRVDLIAAHSKMKLDELRECNRFELYELNNSRGKEKWYCKLATSKEAAKPESTKGSASPSSDVEGGNESSDMD